MNAVQRGSMSCPAECAGCPESGAEPATHEAPFQGWAMALASILVFLVPLATGVLGALAASSSPSSQLLGGVLGLFIGILGVRLCVPGLATKTWTSE